MNSQAKEIFDHGQVIRRGDPLTARENDVLQCLANGCSGREISVFLRISERTVANHRERMKFKLGARTLCHAMVIAISKGLLEIREGE